MLDLYLGEQLGGTHRIRRTGDDLAVLVVLRLDAHCGVCFGHRLRDLGLVDVESGEVRRVQRHPVIAELLLGDAVNLTERVQVAALLIERAFLHFDVGLDRVVKHLHGLRRAFATAERLTETAEEQHDSGERLPPGGHAVDEVVRVDLRVGDLLPLRVDLPEDAAKLFLLLGLQLVDLLLPLGCALRFRRGEVLQFLVLPGLDVDEIVLDAAELLLGVLARQRVFRIGARGELLCASCREGAAGDDRSGRASQLFPGLLQEQVGLRGLDLVFGTGATTNARNRPWRGGSGRGGCRWRRRWRDGRSGHQGVAWRCGGWRTDQRRWRHQRVAPGHSARGGVWLRRERVRYLRVVGAHRRALGQHDPVRDHLRRHRLRGRSGVDLAHLLGHGRRVEERQRSACVVDEFDPAVGLLLVALPGHQPSPPVAALVPTAAPWSMNLP